MNDSSRLFMSGFGYSAVEETVFNEHTGRCRHNADEENCHAVEKTVDVLFAAAHQAVDRTAREHIGPLYGVESESEFLEVVGESEEIGRDTSGTSQFTILREKGHKNRLLFTYR